MVGNTNVVEVRCRGGGAAGAGVKKESAAGGVGDDGVSGAVVAGLDLAVDGGDSAPAGAVVAVEPPPDERPDEPEPDPDPEEPESDPEEAESDPELVPEYDPTEATGARALPVRSGVVPGGVSSGGLALAM
jgi:hypothetical protein